MKYLIDLSARIARINALLEDETEASVTYAALEARLALEQVCYDRLRQHHDYISHADLKCWQPSQIMNTLIAEVDEYANQTRTLSISRTAVTVGRDAADEDYVKLGVEMGFDPKLIGKLWNALGGLALHTRIPESGEHQLSDYGDKRAIFTKVREVVDELERLAATSMTFSGIGETVSFSCDCGSKNRRRAALLHQGQVVSCINPKCLSSWNVLIEGAEISFQPRMVHIKCEACRNCNYIAWRSAAAMKYDEIGSFHCISCEVLNYFQWRLQQVKPILPPDDAVS